MINNTTNIVSISGDSVRFGLESSSGFAGHRQGTPNWYDKSDHHG